MRREQRVCHAERRATEKAEDRGECGALAPREEVPEGWGTASQVGCRGKDDRTSQAQIMKLLTYLQSAGAALSKHSE